MSAREHAQNSPWSKLDEKGYLLIDGGFATTLESKGYSMDRELWSAGFVKDDEEAVVGVHSDFLSAGCDVLITASYQMSYEGFARKGMAEREAEAMFRKATTLALRARNQRVSTSTSFGPALVAASIGCYGAHLANGSEYFGRYDANVRQITAWHKRKFEVLRAASAAEARPDLVVFETIPCVDEAKAIAALLGGAEVGGCSDGVGVADSGADDAVARGSAASSCAGWVSFACKDGATLNSGEPLEDALRALNDPAEDLEPNRRMGIGINCTPPEHVAELISTITDCCGRSSHASYGSASRPIAVYPNSGEVYHTEDNSWSPPEGVPVGASAVDERFAAFASEWFDLGARCIGGCCRTTPATVQAVDATLRHKLGLPPPL